jgi:hypothetical protein
MRRSPSGQDAMVKQYNEIANIPQNLQADRVRRFERVSHPVPSLLSHVEDL